MNSITNYLDVHLEVELCALTINELFLILLCRPTQTVLHVSNFENSVFKKMNANHIDTCTSCASIIDYAINKFNKRILLL